VSLTKELTKNIDSAYESEDEYALFKEAKKLALGISKHDDEVAHEMTVHLFQEMPKFTPMKHPVTGANTRFSTWAVTVLKNKFKDLVSVKSKVDQLDVDEFDGLWMDYLSGRNRFYVPSSEDPVSSTKRDTSRRASIAKWRAITSALNERWLWFPSREAEKAFELMAEGWSRDEIAKHLDIKVRTLDKKLERWREQILANLMSRN
jgi:DNA-directed RNA polymerase specialized sigma24 family protein